ncbi:MAG: hypothetical protein LBV12_06055, partial [Puniceicoccales bacterium]|nr:hypothetical protein [Puniceicoccales bacterium]
MKKLSLLLFLAHFTFFTGCPSTTPIAEDPFRIIGDGVVEHIPSGMQFPETLEDFVRGNIRQYDTSGSNISVA